MSVCVCVCVCVCVGVQHQGYGFPLDQMISVPVAQQAVSQVKVEQSVDNSKVMESMGTYILIIKLHVSAIRCHLNA